jgi:hypothetical protein
MSGFTCNACGEKFDNNGRFLEHHCKARPPRECSSCVALRTRIERVADERDVAQKECHALRALATRWYLADGTFETLPEEEVIRRRKEAEVTLANARALESRMTEEGVAKVMCYLSCVGDAGISGDNWEYVELYWKRCPPSVRDCWLDRARALLAYMKRG